MKTVQYDYMYCVWVQKNSVLIFKSVSICLSLGSAIYDQQYSALTNYALVKGIMQASPLAQTSCLEGFYSVLNQFAPKMTAYVLKLFSPLIAFLGVV